MACTFMCFPMFKCGVCNGNVCDCIPIQQCADAGP